MLPETGRSLPAPGPATPSAQATIVEVSTRDRMGVLYAITHTLAELGLDILLAKVSTEGEKVSDVFYVTRGGKRITEAREREELIERLRTAAEAGGDPVSPR